LVVLAPELIDVLARRCQAELARSAADAPDASEQRLNLDLTPFLSVVSWQIVVPFVLAITARLTADKIVARDLKKKSVAELRASALSAAGRQIHLDDEREAEECVLVVEQLLEPLGIDRKAARRVVEVLRETLPH
jgi:hypothetical protein